MIPAGLRGLDSCLVRMPQRSWQGNQSFIQHKVGWGVVKISPLHVFRFLNKATGTAEGANEETECEEVFQKHLHA